MVDEELKLETKCDDANEYGYLYGLIEPPHPKRVGIPEFFSLNRLIKYFSGKPRWTSGLIY